MAGPRGYRQYRGRTSKAKIAAAIFLVLVILVAVVVILLQRHIVYDETGTPHLELPWEETEPSQSEDGLGGGELDLTIEGPEEPAVEKAAIRAYGIPAGVLTADSWATIQSVMQIAEPRYNAVAVTLKDSSGKVYFDSASAVSGAVKTAEDTAAVLAEVTADGYTIARISCFHDSRAANSYVESMGLKNTGGYIFYDGNNTQWLDPSKPEARSYLCNLAREAAELGFDEILLKDVCYPLEGKLDKIAYGDVDREATLVSFLQEVRAVLEPYSVALSMEVPEAVVAEGKSEAASWTLSGAAKAVDWLYAATGMENIAQYAEKVVAYDVASFVPILEENSRLDGCLVLG